MHVPKETAFRVETIHNEFKSLTKFSSLLKAPENFSVFRVFNDSCDP